MPERLNALKWLDVLPVAWLALVVYAYSAIALQPAPGPERPPAVVGAEQWVLPLLAALVIAGIIRYFGLRRPTIREDAPSQVGAPETSP